MLTGHTFESTLAQRSGVRPALPGEKTLMPQTLNADYKVIVLSGNAFLWLGLKTFISQSVDPCPEIFWINDVSPEGILPLRQLMLNIRVKKGWLVFTDASRVNDIKIILGGERVHVVAGNLSLAQLSRCFQNTPFASVKNATLTCQELRVCMLFRNGFSLVRIAQILNKSPKTIYTHKRNAMNKFHCQNLAEFHRKLFLLDYPASCLSLHG